MATFCEVLLVKYAAAYVGGGEADFSAALLKVREQLRSK
jgi:hypothetical protein